MRTVTFSNADVAKSVNELLLPTWVNRKPGFHNCELQTEREILVDSYECFATVNFVTYFLTPDLDVLHYFSGYYSPKLFLQEVEFVRSLSETVLDENRKLIPSRLRNYAALHAEQSSRRAEEAKKLRSMTPPGDKKDKDLQQFIARRDSYAEGMMHLADVHKDLGRQSLKEGKPIRVARVLSTYKHGNPFTEE
jgi:hypothetical protein